MFRGVPCRYRVSSLDFLGLVKGCLQENFHLQGPALGEMAQILFIQVGQVVLNIHIAVQVDIGVFRAVVFLVEGNEPFLGQFRNGFRQTAGFKPVGGIREQGLAHLVLLDGVRGGVYPFHFVVHHAVVDQGLVLPFAQLVMPAFLLQGEGVFAGQGIEHRIQVHIHQVAEILVVPAGHRVHRLIGVGHGVQERIQGTFHQFHKGFLQPVLPAAAEHRVLGNVGYPRVILAGGAETNGKYLVVVRAGHIKHPGAADLMDQLVPCSVNVRQCRDFFYCKPMQMGMKL